MSARVFGSPWPVVAAAVLIASTSLAACLGGPRLQHAEGSPEALILAMLTAIQDRDAERLRSLALSEEEFRDLVWPELPAAMPERNLPFSYVWTDLRTKSEAHLAALLSRHGGELFHLLQFRFTGGTAQYRSYLVHRGTELVLRDAKGGEHEVRFFGSVIEQGGRFKIFSYVAD